eukprot:3362682-Rhodomonas_salina.3
MVLAKGQLNRKLGTSEASESVVRARTPRVAIACGSIYACVTSNTCLGCRVLSLRQYQAVRVEAYRQCAQEPTDCATLCNRGHKPRHRITQDCAFDFSADAVCLGRTCEFLVVRVVEPAHVRGEGHDAFPMAQHVQPILLQPHTPRQYCAP